MIIQHTSPIITLRFGGISTFFKKYRFTKSLQQRNYSFERRMSVHIWKLFHSGTLPLVPADELQSHRLLLLLLCSASTERQIRISIGSRSHSLNMIAHSSTFLDNPAKLKSCCSFSSQCDRIETLPGGKTHLQCNLEECAILFFFETIHSYRHDCSKQTSHHGTKPNHRVSFLLLLSVKLIQMFSLPLKINWTVKSILNLKVTI